MFINIHTKDVVAEWYKFIIDVTHSSMTLTTYQYLSFLANQLANNFDYGCGLTCSWRSLNQKNTFFLKGQGFLYSFRLVVSFFNLVELLVEKFDVIVLVPFRYRYIITNEITEKAIGITCELLDSYRLHLQVLYVGIALQIKTVFLIFSTILV